MVFQYTLTLKWFLLGFGRYLIHILKSRCFIKSGLTIPINTEKYTDGIETVEQAKWTIVKMWYDIDNQ